MTSGFRTKKSAHLKKAHISFLQSIFTDFLWYASYEGYLCVRWRCNLACALPRGRMSSVQKGASPNLSQEHPAPLTCSFLAFWGAFWGSQVHIRRGKMQLYKGHISKLAQTYLGDVSYNLLLHTTYSTPWHNVYRNLGT